MNDRTRGLLRLDGRTSPRDRQLSLEQRLQDLADREAIRDLIALYAHRAAHGVSPADLFADDGVMIWRLPGQPAQEVRGREALDRSFGEAAGMADRPLPMLHNFLIDIDGDEAIGLSSNEVRVTQDGESMIGSGYYEDEFRCENGQWKFVVRSVTMFHWAPLRHGWAETDPLAHDRRGVLGGSRPVD